MRTDKLNTHTHFMESHQAHAKTKDKRNEPLIASSFLRKRKQTEENNHILLFKSLTPRCASHDPFRKLGEEAGVGI